MNNADSLQCCKVPSYSLLVTTHTGGGHSSFVLSFLSRVEANRVAENILGVRNHLVVKLYDSNQS